MTENLDTDPTSLPPGIRSRTTLRGHTRQISRIAWSPQGTLLASCSEDGLIRLWEIPSGNCSSELRGHTAAALALAFDSAGARLASGGADGTIQFWNTHERKRIAWIATHAQEITGIAFAPGDEMLASAATNGAVKLWATDSLNLDHTFREYGSTERGAGFDFAGRLSRVRNVAFAPIGLTLAADDANGIVTLWDAETGTQLRSLAEHAGAVTSLAFDPTGLTLATAGIDRTVKIWDTSSGQLLCSLEGHTGPVTTVAFSPDGQLLASKGDERDGTIRIWNAITGAAVATIPEPVSTKSAGGIAFHPRLPLLASVGADHGSLNEIEFGVALGDRVVHLWELDYETLLGQPTAPAITYTSAKIVLVGDSGVGKTGLGWRLTHGEFKHHESTHGQQFWVFNELSPGTTDGGQCEAILWDLAGQPDYRLINSLFLDDSDLVLILYDPTDSNEPLRGVEFWLRRLQVNSDHRSHGAGVTTAPAILMIASRSDRGTSTLTQSELDAYCAQNGIDGHLSVSARTGDGIRNLIERMKQLVSWDTKPATVTTATFKRIKDYILRLKESGRQAALVLPPLQLRERLEQQDSLWRFTNAEMMTAIAHLENHGYIKRLRTSKGEARVLLRPDLLNNLAASFVLEARRNARGLGALEQDRLLSGDYQFPELKGLERAEQEVLLDSAALLFLEHTVCFRETNPLTSKSYLVFPDLINMKRPTLDDEVATEDGVSYSISGAMENVYASLVVLLGYTQTFTRTAQWRNHARYEVGDGLVCGFRLDADRDGELDFVLYFDKRLKQSLRDVFKGLFESFLSRRNLTVYRYEPVQCTRGHRISRDVVRQQLRDHAEFAFCSKCGEKVGLARADAPIQLTQELDTQVDAQRRIVGLRSCFEQTIFSIQNFGKQGLGRNPQCVISYAWGEPEHERWVERQLAQDLQKAGIVVLLDRWQNSKIGGSIRRFLEQMEKSDRIIVVGTPLYLQKDNPETPRGHVVAAESDLIGQRLLGSEGDKATVLPILLSGTPEESFPPLLRGRVFADFTSPSKYFTAALDLILSLYDIAVYDPAITDLRDALRAMHD